MYPVARRRSPAHPTRSDATGRTPASIASLTTRPPGLMVAGRTLSPFVQASAPVLGRPTRPWAPGRSDRRPRDRLPAVHPDAASLTLAVDADWSERTSRLRSASTSELK